MFKPGTKVFADAGAGVRVGFVLDGPDGPEDKYEIQIGSSVYGGMTFRDPKDPNNTTPENTGMTFWKV